MKDNKINFKLDVKRKEKYKTYKRVFNNHGEVSITLKRVMKLYILSNSGIFNLSEYF